MLIFDQFKSVASADRFAAAATKLSGLPSVVCLDYREFDRHEVFPFELSFPVSLVGRSDLDTEEAIERLASSFGGVFAGT